MEGCMSDIFCLDPAYSTTRSVTRTEPVIEKSQDSQVDGMLFLPHNPDRNGEGGLRTKGYFKSSLPGKPLVSIVTVVFNGEKYLEQTIQSVINQTYDAVEYIIIDGGSTDGTLDIIKKYDSWIDYWVSEPDSGISDAFNKGIVTSSGDLIGMINADDWYDPCAVEVVVNNFRSIICFSYAGCTYVSNNGRTKYIPPIKNYSRQIRKYMPHLHHPTIFVKREIYFKIGLFEKKYKYAMDYSFLLRLYLEGFIGTPLFRNIVYMRTGGVSDKMYWNTRKEVYHISHSHGLPKPIAQFFYCWFVFKYLVRKALNVG